MPGDQSDEEGDPTSDLETARAAKAGSGKWHLVGKHGCLNAGQASFTRTIQSVTSDKRNREWCRYCAERLRILELRAELARVRRERDALKADRDIASHVSLADLIAVARDSETLLEAQRELRMDRNDLKMVLNRVGLLSLFSSRSADGKQNIPSVPDAPNHGVGGGASAAPHSGWGQRSTGDSDAE